MVACVVIVPTTRSVYGKLYTTMGDGSALRAKAMAVSRFTGFVAIIIRKVLITGELCLGWRGQLTMLVTCSLLRTNITS